MGVVRLSQSEITDYQKYSSMLAGNPAYSPPVYDLLATTVLTSDTRTVTFSSLDTYSAYKHLQIRMVVRSANANALTLRVRANGDTGSNYARNFLRGTGSAVQSGDSSSQTQIDFGVSAVPRSDFTLNVFGAGILDILDFSSSAKTTTFRLFTGSGNPNNYEQIGLASGLWNSTNALTSIDLYHGTSELWQSGSRFSIYGIKG